MAQPMNELINDKGVCRTAQATLREGLKKTEENVTCVISKVTHRGW